MFSFLKKATATNITVNSGTFSITQEPQQTILSSALKAGVRFPHRCKVGSCATCKCKLLKGKVKELTESAYVLSEEELSLGYILTCQSIPKTNVEIEFTAEQITKMQG